MKALFLTSSIGGYKKVIKGNVTTKEIIKCDNTNGFIDELKKFVPKISTFCFVASNPDGAEKSDEYSNVIASALNLDGFQIENVIVIDHRFSGNIQDAISSADVVFLAGGHVPTQNKYFKEIGLKNILEHYDGVVIGQSAGSMNCAKEVYVQPESREEFYDKSFQKLLSGLGLTEIKVMPHMNKAKIDEIDGTTTYDMCLKDSYKIPHYGICDYGFIEIADEQSVAFGKTYLMKNGKCKQLCDDKEHYVIDTKNMYNERN